MKIRYDAVFVSSALFTVAFLLLVPGLWQNAQAGIPFWHFGRAAQQDRTLLDTMGPGFADSALLLGQAGIGGFAVLFVALTVIWKGYIRKLRWTWFVMLTIVWGWYFPLFIYQSLSYARGFDKMAYLFYSPWAWIFFAMLVALILPVRSFFRKQQE